MPDSLTPTQVDIGATNPLIFQKMPMILAEIGGIEKKGRNDKQNFNFRGIDQVYDVLYPILAKHKVFMTAAVLGTSREERKSNSGGVLAFTCIHMRYRFYAEDGSHVETDAYGEGMDSGDKSSNKAMAVAHKYAILQAFCVPVHEMDDPDKDSHEVAPRVDPADRIRQEVGEAVAWINAQTDPQVIHAAHSAKMDWFLALPVPAQEHINKAREAQLRKIAPPQTDAPQSDADQKEAWTNKSIAWINGQTSMEAIAKFWTTNAALIKGLEAYQLAPLEKAKNAAKARLTGIQGPTKGSAMTPAINLDDEINFAPEFR